MSLALHAALGRYRTTEAILSGALTSSALHFDFADITPIHRAFAPMVRTLAFDMSEIAIATFLQARAYDKPLVLLPVAVAARFQEAALLCRDDSRISGPADLAGRRVGVRSYAQTTGMWLRGILADDFAVPPDAVRWTTFEDAHVPEFRDPPFVQRAPAGSDMVGMLRDGRLDAIIVGNEMPDDATFRTVFADPAAAGRAFRHRHAMMPVNHVVCLQRSLVEQRPGVVGDLMGLFRTAYAAAPDGGRNLPLGRAALAPAIALACRYAEQQGLLPHPLAVEDVWQGLPDSADW